MFTPIFCLKAVYVETNIRKQRCKMSFYMSKLMAPIALAHGPFTVAGVLRGARILFFMDLHEAALTLLGRIPPSVGTLYTLSRFFRSQNVAAPIPLPPAPPLHPPLPPPCPPYPPPSPPPSALPLPPPPFNLPPYPPPPFPATALARAYREHSGRCCY